MDDIATFSVHPSDTLSVADLPAVRAIGTAVPDLTWDQATAYDFLSRHVPFYRRKAIERVFQASGINSRHFAYVPERLSPRPTVDELQTAFETEAPRLGVQAARAALEDGSVSPAEIDGLVVATSTGYLCPGLAARIAPALGLRADVMRTELVGAGCAGALPALRRGHDFALANPRARVLVICVELCSTCVYTDEDMETVVGNAICADGAAALVLDGPIRARGEPARAHLPRIGQFATAADPGALDLVGFAQPERYLRIVLSQKVPDHAGGLVRQAVARSLEAYGRADAVLDHYVVHPGGRRVLDRLGADLALPDEALAVSRQILRDYGNMSSPTVLFVLAETLKSRSPRAGQMGLMGALGPGMVAETALLHWT